MTILVAPAVGAPVFPASAEVDAIIRLALAEDVGRGDLTTEATVSADKRVVADLLEKDAVRVGGASNHRAGLDDGFLIKENHIRAAGGITRAVEAAHERAAPGQIVEVEVTTLDELDEAISAGATLILLDNFSIAEL